MATTPDPEATDPTQGTAAAVPRPVGSSPAAPPPKSLRDVRKAETTERLAHAALRLFAEHGYTRTSVDDIVKAAGFSVPTFFRHFSTKEDVAFFEWGDLWGHMSSVLQDTAPEDVWPTVRDATLSYLTLFQEASETGFEDIRRELWLNEPAVRRRFAELCLHWENVIASVLAEGLGLDPDKDPYPRTAAVCLIGITRMSQRLQYVNGGVLADHARSGLALIEPCLSQVPRRQE